MAIQSNLGAGLREPPRVGSSRLVADCLRRNYALSRAPSGEAGTELELMSYADIIIDNTMNARAVGQGGMYTVEPVDAYILDNLNADRVRMVVRLRPVPPTRIPANM
jgi:hypothetical protein